MQERLNNEAISRAREFAAAAAAQLATPDAMLARLEAMNDEGLDATNQMQRFFLILETLALDPEQLQITAAQTERLYALATDLLRLLGVKARSSRFSYLFGEIELRRGLSTLRRGYPWEALAAIQGGRTLASRGASPSLHAHLALAAAECCVALGHGDLAGAGLSLSVLSRLPITEVPKLWRLRLSLARWQGNTANFRDEVAACQASAKGLPDCQANELKALLSWEERAFEASQSADAKQLIQAAARGGPLAEFRYTIKAYLWSFAARLPTGPRGFANAESIRRHYGLNLRIVCESTRLLTLAKAFEDCHDTGIPLERRIDGLEVALAELPRVTDIDAVQLARSAAARWLRDSQQSLSAAARLQEYRLASRGLSGGKSDDVYGFGIDMRTPAWERFQAEETPAETARPRDSFTNLKTAPVRRAAELTWIGLGTLPKLLKHRFSLLFSDKSETKALRRVMDDEVVEYLVRKIGELKGPIVKIAQMTSVIHAALPDAVYQAIVRLREDSPGLAPAVARAVVQQELGDDAFTRLFSEWDDHPIAAASIGQVHRAVTCDGLDVAVKVQYPGIEEGIRADIRLLRLVIVPIYKILFPKVDLRAVADAVEAEVLRECDYRIEAEIQAKMRDRLTTADVKIPRVFPELSSRRVLTMELVRGQRFSAYVRVSTQGERDRIGANIAKVMFGSCFSGEDFSTDPHPGNYLFPEGGAVTLIDFGATSRMPTERIKLFRDVAAAAASDDLEGFKMACTALGYVGDESFDFASEMKNAQMIMRPLLSGGSFRFGPDYFAEVFGSYGLASVNRKRVRFAAGDIPLWRFLIGLQVLLCELEAEADWSQIFWDAIKAPRSDAAHGRVS